MSQVTIVLANGESQEVTAVSNMMGNTKAFEFRAITPSGEVRTYRGSLADSTFTPVPEGGAILGALEAAFQLDERTILSKYGQNLNPQQTLARDKEIYEMKRANFERWLQTPSPLYFNPETNTLTRYDLPTAGRCINNLVAVAEKQGVFGLQNQRGLYPDTMNPTGPGIPAPYVQVPGAQGQYNPGMGGMGTNQPNEVASAANIGHGNSKFGGKKGNGRIFGMLSGSEAQNLTTEFPQSSKTPLGDGNWNNLSPQEVMVEILKAQAASQGAQPNLSPDDPFVNSYAFRREKPNLNAQILEQEECRMSASELFQAHANKDFVAGQVKMMPIPGTGPTEPLHAVVGPAQKRYLVKPINPTTWNQQEVEVIRRMISTGKDFQAFEGFYRDPATQNVYATFQEPTMTVSEFASRSPITDDRVKWLFNGILRALCELDSLGIHHPNLHINAVCLADGDQSSLMLLNPFLSDSLYQEVATVYCNKFNTLYGRAAFNRRYLQENVYEMFLILLTFITGGDFKQFSPAPGQFNAQAIQRGLETAVTRSSPQIGELLKKYLLIPVDQQPTPLMVANLESIPVELNSYYGHSKNNTTFYYPFEPFVSTRKLFANKPGSGNNRIPHWSEIDVYKNDDDLQISRMYGISYRKKNFVIDEGPQKPLRPYYIKLKDMENYGLDHNASMNPIENVVQSNFVAPADSVARIMQPPPQPAAHMPTPIPIITTPAVAQPQPAQRMYVSEPRVTYITHAPREVTNYPRQTVQYRPSNEYRPLLDSRASSPPMTTYIQQQAPQRIVTSAAQPTLVSGYTSSQGPSFFQQTLPQPYGQAAVSTGRTTYSRPL